MIREADNNNLAFMEVYKVANNLNEVMIKSELMPQSPYKTMFVEGHKELMKIKETFDKSGRKDSLQGHFQHFGLGLIERALQKGINQSNAYLEKFLSLLASIGSVSPFVGLFGTVWGIIDSFTGIAKGGSTLDAVAPGIAEALVATAIGLAAAIPAVWFYNHFSSMNARINNDMESFGQEFLNVVERSLIAVD